MDKRLLHDFIDDCWDGWIERKELDDSEPMGKPYAEIEVPETEVVEETKPTHDPDTRVIRTKATGDKVYLLNDKEMTKRWITSPKVLEGLGFSFSDVGDLPDLELAKYKPVSAAFNA